MFNHAPAGYACPFCAIARGIERPGVHTVAADVVLRTDAVIAFVASHGWPRNPGHVIVVPVEHYENLYEVPDGIGAAVFAASRRIAVALRSAYGCDGTSVRQHNEPAGNQDVWHYHVHVFPRSDADDLYGTPGPEPTPLAVRAAHAAQLRTAIGSV